MAAVFENETLVKKPVSSPDATPATAINTATPKPRLTHPGRTQRTFHRRK
jgi:hypothetical protein